MNGLLLLAILGQLIGDGPTAYTNHRLRLEQGLDAIQASRLPASDEEREIARYLRSCFFQAKGAVLAGRRNSLSEERAGGLLLQESLLLEQVLRKAASDVRPGALRNRIERLRAEWASLAKTIMPGATSRSAPDLQPRFNRLLDQSIKEMR